MYSVEYQADRDQQSGNVELAIPQLANQPAASLDVAGIVACVGGFDNTTAIDTSAPYILSNPPEAEARGSRRRVGQRRLEAAPGETEIAGSFLVQSRNVDSRTTRHVLAAIWIKVGISFDGRCTGRRAVGCWLSRSVSVGSSSIESIDGRLVGYSEGVGIPAAAPGNPS